MSDLRILVACVGNIFMGDDGFGVEVARLLQARTLPAGVVVKDFGIRGYDLAYALLEPSDLVLLVDAYSRGREPGTIYLIEPDLIGAADHDDSTAIPDAHGMDPARVLAMVRSMGSLPARLLLVGCEPADFGPDEGKLGLSDVVAAAAGQAANLIEKLISKELEKEASCVSPYQDR